MKHVWRLVRESKKYAIFLIIASVSLLLLTAASLISPSLISDLVAILTEDFSAADIPRVWNLALFLLLSYIARGLFRFINNYFSHYAAWNMVSAMRVKVYEHLQKLSLRYYSDKQTGQIMSRVINDTASFELLIAHAIPDLVSNILILIGVTVLLLFVNVKLTLLTFIPVPLIILGSVLYAKKIRPYFTAAQSRLADMNAILQDNLSGIKEIQVFGQQERESRRFSHRANHWSDAMLKALRLSGMYHPLVEVIISLGTVIVVGFGGVMALDGLLSASDIVRFLLYLSMFYAPITTLARVVEDMQQAIVGAERVYAILDTHPDIQDTPGAKALKKPSTGHIGFDQVSFQYDGDTQVLDNVSFDIPSGKMVALVGPTGVGKTTIASLIARFYDPDSGRVTLDGQDIRGLTLDSLRSQISIVLQDVFLFNGTIAENIAYGVKSPTQEQVVRAAQIAHIHEFIASLPDGYNTVVGERGVRLSGGQNSD